MPNSIPYAQKVRNKCQLLTLALCTGGTIGESVCVHPASYYALNTGVESAQLNSMGECLL